METEPLPQGEPDENGTEVKKKKKKKKAYSKYVYLRLELLFLTV